MVLRSIFESVLAYMAGHPGAMEVYGRVAMGLAGPQRTGEQIEACVCDYLRVTGGGGAPRVSCKP